MSIINDLKTGKNYYLFSRGRKWKIEITMQSNGLFDIYHYKRLNGFYISRGCKCNIKESQLNDKINNIIDDYRLDSIDLCIKTIGLKT